ncbi:uncharacterized protein Z520_00008 [Fonsecaea multimorphosa CBS 102226]|uniref:G-patch domain-containing protein n=1 Tax=Fonsecaea multimorphosa CBS 102226 TaxID=1442371 RepID=A0A0D2J1R4_9EURO|nr:uncharacterized protein Z520_00008 [Fonsecaea multimorphosa CBS 102226]KIY03317.1 hypothetical protein Z520_00008 [Fonsecaea multimorphosa CBS 102226]OAL32968.1 hypothetical protein AYO22_00053 [Fonsecaea multimorphosa]
MGSEAASNDDEDDYMNMTFEEDAAAHSSSKKNETLTQRKKRLAREAEIKGRPKSKAELAQEERKKRESALNTTTLDTSNRGFKMMAALGYKPGSALGASRGEKDGEKDDRLLEPIGLEMRETRSGIGADAEKKRKFREEVEAQQEADKKRKVEAGEFRERQQKEREEKKMEGQMWAAMKVCERLDEEDDELGQQSVEDRKVDETTAQPRRRSKPLKSVNVLWRSLLKQRAINERDRRMRYDLHQSLSRRPDYIDPDEEKEDQMAMGKNKAEVEEVDVDLDEEDEELTEFEALEVSERLSKLVAYLRERWNYCFWCKYKYPDEKMEGCPGLTEADHD